VARIRGELTNGAHAFWVSTVYSFSTAVLVSRHARTLLGLVCVVVSRGYIHTHGLIQQSRADCLPGCPAGRFVSQMSDWVLLWCWCDGTEKKHRRRSGKKGENKKKEKRKVRQGKLGLAVVVAVTACVCVCVCVVRREGKVRANAWVSSVRSRLDFLCVLVSQSRKLDGGRGRLGGTRQHPTRELQPEIGIPRGG